MKQQQKIANMIRIQTTIITNNNINYTKVENHTNIQFTHKEIQLLNEGLKYNLHHKNKKRTETLALEAETAISNLDISEQNYYRHAVARKLKDISKNNKANNKRDKEWK
jgi:hypothetical protein